MQQMSLAEEYNQQGRGLYGLDKYDEALDFFRKAEEKDPSYLRTYINKAELYITTHQLDKAKEELNKVLYLDKNNGEANFHLGNIAYLEQDAKMAVSYLTKAYNSDYRNPRTAYHLACLYIDMHKDEQALFYLNKLLKEDPFQVEARLRKMEILVGMRKYEEALRNADEMIELLPDTFEGYHYKFVTLLGLQRYPEAKQAVERAMELFPDDLGFVYDLIKYYEQVEEYDRAMELIDDRFQANAQDRRSIRKEKAKLMFAMGKADETKELLESIVAEDYDDEMCYCLMQVYGGFGEYDKALECCRKIIEGGRDSQYYYSAVYHEAVACDRLERKKEAEEKYRRAANTFRMASARHPGMLGLYLYRALCYRRLGEYDRAMEMTDYLITISDQKFGEAYFVQGLIYEDLNDEKKAREYKEKGLAMSTVLNQFFSL